MSKIYNLIDHCLGIMGVATVVAIFSYLLMILFMTNLLLPGFSALVACTALCVALAFYTTTASYEGTIRWTGEAMQCKIYDYQERIIAITWHLFLNTVIGWIAIFGGSWIGGFVYDVTSLRPAVHEAIVQPHRFIGPLPD